VKKLGFGRKKGGSERKKELKIKVLGRAGKAHVRMTQREEDN